MPLPVAIILNGISRKKKNFYAEVYPTLSKTIGPEVLETKFAGHAVELAAQATRDGFGIVISAGGDGTLNQVINGVLSDSRYTTPSVGIIPMGTGNDFARMNGLAFKVQLIKRLIEENRPSFFDVGKLTCQNNGVSIHRYFINACSIGMGPAVVKRLETNNRILGASLTYWKTITTTFFTYRPQLIHCKASSWEWEGRIRVLAIANGKTFGHGIYLAPDGKPDDGLLNTFIAGDLPLGKFLMYQQSLKGTRKVKDNKIMYNTTTDVLLTSPESCAIETEGELAGYLPAQIEVVRNRIPFLK